MRVFVAIGVVLAAGMSLAACSGQGGNSNSSGKIARATVPASVPGDPLASVASAAKPARFAAMPDRGELLRYGAQSPVRDGAYTWHRAELSEQHALDAIASGVLKVATPDGHLLGFRYDRSIRHDSGDWTWIGHLPGQEGVQAILTFGKDAVYGSIGQPDTRPLRLTMRGGASWLVETDPTQLAGLASHAANPVSPDYQIVTPEALQRLREKRAASGGMKASALAPNAVSATAASTPTVDLLIGYTQGFVAAKGSTSAVVTRLNSMVDTANVGLSNSQVNGQIRLVYTMQVNYTDTNDNGDALGQLTGYDSDTQKETTPNAAFNALRAARETYGADLVSLVRPFREPEQDSCGIAWLVGGGKQGDTVIANNGWDYFGYSVVSDGTDFNETDKKTYFCEEHTLAHELGHNMGSNHDRGTAKGDDDVLDDPDDYGAFAYSFGYKPGAFYTIMAYGDKGQTSYLTFSNPGITICGGVACGVANSEDNARSLGTILPNVAQFRATAVPQAGGIVVSDFDGDGKSDVFWRNFSSGANIVWKAALSGMQQSVSKVSNLAWVVVGTGDYDGEGHADVLWRNLSTGANLIWFAAKSSTQQAIGSVGDLNWHIVGSGDYDGDGHSDVFWRNFANGVNTIWLSANRLTIQPVIGVGDLNWQVMGSGDYNGDGRSDILWRNKANGGNTIWLSADKSTQQPMSGVGDLNWKIAGSGDFNGDGKSDVLWRNKATGANTIWLSANNSTQQSMAVMSDLNWDVVATGDYNGDGRTDVLWRNKATGANAIWLSADKTKTMAVTSIANLDWMAIRGD